MKNYTLEALKHPLFYVLVLASVLRIFHAGNQSFWTDEVQSYEIASRASLLEISEHSFELTTQPPLYFLLLKMVLLFDNSELTQRTISIASGVGLVFLIYFVAKMLFNRGVGLVSSVLLSISPFHLYYSQESRPYALFLVFGLLSILILMHALKSEKTYYWGILAISTALAIYTHTIGFQLFVLQLILLLILVPKSDLWKNLKWLVLSWVLAAFLLSPFIYQVLNAHDSIPAITSSASRQNSALLDVAYGFYTFLVGFSLGPSPRILHGMDTISVFKTYWPSILFTGVTLSIMSFFARQYLKNLSWRVKGILGAWLFVSFILVVLVARITGSILQVRYIIFAFPPFIILLSLGFRGKLDMFLISDEKAIVLSTSRV